MCHKSPLPDNSLGGGLLRTWTKSGAHWSPALQTAWSPRGEGSWLQDGSTSSRRGYEALAIKFKLRIRHTLPRADSRHQLLIFRLEKPFLTDTGGEAGAHRTPVAPAAPRPSPKGQRKQPSKHFPPSLSPLMVKKDQSGLLYCSRADHEKLSQHPCTGCAQPQYCAAACLAPLS